MSSLDKNSLKQHLQLASEAVAEAEPVRGSWEQAPSAFERRASLCDWTLQQIPAHNREWKHVNAGNW